jgi:hypothetical protein
MLTRKEFKNYFNKKFDIVGDNHPLWIPDHDLAEPCQYFVNFPIPTSQHVWRGGEKSEFWLWCDTNLYGETRCFSSSDNSEWWGFTTKDDIVMFVLKWS